MDDGPIAASKVVPLGRMFFAPGAARVAKALLGHWLIRRETEGFSGGLIVETEAYLADDPASHGFRGKTRRNASMFGPAGRAYMYFIYGNHWCFNAVCGQEGVAAAVLVRAVEPLFGVNRMRNRRPVAVAKELTNGPAKLCEALGLDREQDGIDLSEDSSPVILARNPKRSAAVRQLGPVVRSTRVGLSKAADWPLRFYLGGSEFVSRKPRGKSV